MKVSVVEFPGSHCASDTKAAVSKAYQAEVTSIWHEEEDLKGAELLIIPGGASFGDSLRPGALARTSAIAGQIRKFATDGGYILGIGNGFQILCEIGVLPGGLLENVGNSFLNEVVGIKVDSLESPFTRKLKEGEVIKLPICCYRARYYADTRTIKDIEEGGRVAFRYCDQFGDVDYESPYNESLNAIAGITNRHGNVLGMMPHPEYAMDPLLGSTAGLKILDSICDSICS